MNSKYEIIAERIMRRIARGDYRNGLLPPERELAGSFGICQNTARRAIQKLLTEGKISRLPNGRLELDTGRNLLQIALLAAAWDTPEVNEWYIAIQRFSGKYRFCVKVVYYLHNDDPVIPATIRDYDCSFLLPPYPVDARHRRIVEGLKKIGKPFFVLNNNWSKYGVPSLLTFRPRHTERMLEHLVDLGHKRIDCINVQPGSYNMPQRIEVWKQWITEHDFKGDLFNEPVEAYTETIPHAYRLTDKLLQQGQLREGALLCLTDACAFGVMRALVDNGLRAGEDIAVATVDASIRAEYSIPSLTSMAQVDLTKDLERCFHWLRKKDRTFWEGPLIMGPEDNEVVARQSTVTEIDQKQTPQRRIGK